MRTLISVLSGLALCACMSWAQQPPPADGVGIGTAHMDNTGNGSGQPTIDPAQNQALTGTRGSTTGRNQNPVFAGSSGARTASSMNSQASASGSTSATAARRRASERLRGAQKKSAKGANTGPQQSAGTSSTGAGEDKLLAPNMGPSTTEAPGPSTGNKTHPNPPRR